MKIKQNKQIKSMVLVLCVWLLVIMIIVVMGIVHVSMVNSYTASNMDAKVRAKWAARAGVQYAVDLITQNPTDFNDSYDILRRLKGAEKQQVSTNSYFILSAYDSEKEKTEYGIYDESAKINLLTASDKQVSDLLKVSPDVIRQNLNIFDTKNKKTMSDTKSIRLLRSSRYYAKNIRIIASESQLSLADCYGEDTNLNGILDWNENDGELFPPNDNADGNLETGLFHNATLYSYERNIDREGEQRINVNLTDEFELAELLRISLSEAMWVIENTPMETTADLFPDNITPEDFTGEIIAAPIEAVKENKIQVNDDGSEEIIPEPLSVQALRRIFNKITITDEPVIPGKVNINTASSQVLAAALGITEEQAGKIIKKRESLSNGFFSPAEIFSVDVLDYQHLKDSIDLLTVQGNVFTIVSVGRCNDSNVCQIVEAVVDISQSSPSYLFWREY